VRAVTPHCTVLLTFAVASTLIAGRAEADERAEAFAIPTIAQGPYVHTFGAVGYGRGLRFNNPYRLQTELGRDAQSVSTTAGYLDFSLGAALGAPNGFQHGLVTHLSLAVNGIGQQVLSASYIMLHPLVRQELVGYVRAGLPLILGPDFSLGLEGGAGAAYFFSSAFALTGEAIFSMFAGAATWEHDPTWWPIASFQLGLWVDYEVLP
jgi:hypothetical protein